MKGRLFLLSIAALLLFFFGLQCFVFQDNRRLGGVGSRCHSIFGVAVDRRVRVAIIIWPQRPPTAIVVAHSIEHPPEKESSQY